MLRLTNITKKYWLDQTEVQALRGVSLEVKPGESLAVVGPSGSGKSTLLHIAGLIDEPSGGEMFFDEKPIMHLNDDEKTDFRRDCFGFVFQSFHLVPVLSCLENVALPAIVKGLPVSRAQARAQELLDDVGLGTLAKRNVKALSGGQRQRVAIARALVNRPKVIFADEPTANLDVQAGTLVIDVLLGLCAAHATSLVLATHDRNISARAHRIIQMRDGNKVSETQKSEAKRS